MSSKISINGLSISQNNKHTSFKGLPLGSTVSLVTTSGDEIVISNDLNGIEVWLNNKRIIPEVE